MERWSSQIGFILAAIGAAVGIGNIWRFSAVLGQNGGGAYLIPYFIAVFFFALPLMVPEGLRHDRVIKVDSSRSFRTSQHANKDKDQERGGRDDPIPYCSDTDDNEAAAATRRISSPGIMGRSPCSPVNQVFCSGRDQVRSLAGDLAEPVLIPGTSR